MTIFLRSRSISLLVAFGFATALSAPVCAAGITEKVLHAFSGGSDGVAPSGGLVADAMGNLYGITNGGGTGTGCYGGNGCGTLFTIARDGGESVLYSFQGGADGISPIASLLMDTSGNLYGVTLGGGADDCAGYYGCGTVFKFTPGGTESVLYAFQGGSDGWFPRGGLISDASGNLYGETGVGGNYSGSLCSTQGCGTVFEIQPDGTKNTLYTFEAGNDGAFPGSGVIADTSGNLYGTTANGGGSSCNGDGCGTVFKLAPDGTETVLYAFHGETDGWLPVAGVVRDSSGNLYGTTIYGGTGPEAQGTVFKVSPSGQETILHSFNGGSDGAEPQAPLVMDKKGNLYGTTYYGGGTGCKSDGNQGCGTVFEITSKGKEKVLYAFSAHFGTFPTAGLLLGEHGKLYGTTSVGGKYKDGVAFELKK